MHEGIHHFLHKHSPMHIHTPKKFYLKVKTILWDEFLNFFELVCLPCFCLFFFMEKDKKLHGSIECVSRTKHWRDPIEEEF